MGRRVSDLGKGKLEPSSSDGYTSDRLLNFYIPYCVFYVLDEAQRFRHPALFQYLLCHLPYYLVIPVFRYEEAYPADEREGRKKQFRQIGSMHNGYCLHLGKVYNMIYMMGVNSNAL